MHLVEVTDRKLAEEFLAVNVRCNNGNPHYIRPLDKDVHEVFDPKKNKAFRFGTARRWLLQNEAGIYVGRIAAFVNKKYKSKGDTGPVGGIGFFDCPNNQAAANLLFTEARTWLQQQGMTAMDGPINFGERDKFWGLVVAGFQEPLYGMNYNPPYYQQLFEGYGFQPFFNQICLGTNPKAPMTQKLIDRHAVYAQNPDFTARHISKKKLDAYAADFATVYNAAWAGHGGMKEMRKEQAVQLFRKMKPVMDERIVWFVYHREQPIAMFMNLPDLNQWFKYLDGKFGPWQKLKFLWLKRTKPSKKFTGLAFGVVPQFQGKGVDAYMIVEASNVIQSPAVAYTDYEMQWIGDFNPKMLNVAQSLGETFQSRRLTTYRYLFNRNQLFQRHPMV